MDAAAIQPKLWKYLDVDGDAEQDMDRADRTAGAIAVLLGRIAKKAGDATKANEVANRMAAMLQCPSLEVQLGAAE